MEPAAAARSFAIVVTESKPVTAYCLSMHARYRCGHSGECCTAGWPIPAEPPLVIALARTRLGPAWTAERAFEEQPGPDGTTRVLRTRDGHACVFYEADDARCRVHRLAGEDVLPSACRNFPRMTLHDARGLFITLSHYCPTAAALLVDAGEIAIVEAPASLSLNGEAEGLDATTVLPPLLRPGMLTDLAGYSAWERASIAALDDWNRHAGNALEVIAKATADICTWQPGREALSTRVEAAFDRVRLEVAPGPPAPAWPDRAIKAFLAAHLFASWRGYQDGGLAAIVSAVEEAHVTLTHELLGRRSLGEDGSRASFILAVRAADFRLRHIRTDVRSRSLPPLRDHRHPVR